MDKSVKILHLNTYSSGGAAVAAIGLHLNLLEAGYDSKMLFRYGRKRVKQGFYWNEFNDNKKRSSGIFSVFRSFYKKVKDIKLKNHLGKVEIFSSPNSDCKLENVNLVKEADIIQLHWVSDFVNLKTFFAEVKKPIIWYFHDMNPIYGGVHYSLDLKNIVGTPLHQLEKSYNEDKDASIPKADQLHIICDSDWLKELAVNSPRFSSARSIDTLYYSIDFNDFYPLDKSIAKQTTNTPENKINILFGADNLRVTRKGIKKLIDAINLSNEKAQIMITIFGDFEHGLDKIDESVEVRYYGWISNCHLLRLVYSSADLFVIPSLQEAFGQTALEALACGTPVVGFEVGGIPEVISNGINGLLAPDLTSECLNERIQLFINDFELRQKITSNARKSVIDKFNQSRQLESISKLYTRALDE